jgi:hypothetical protein
MHLPHVLLLLLLLLCLLLLLLLEVRQLHAGPVHCQLLGLAGQCVEMGR